MDAILSPNPDELANEYSLRFTAQASQRRRVWRVLIDHYFQPLVGSDQRVLDLGCGWGEFVNQIQAKQRYAMDLNPEARQKLDREVTFLEQDCSMTWSLPDGSLDVIFTSNFFEHLFDKAALTRTLNEAARCLAPGGRLICMGPNIRYLAGAYWDFYDHYLPLSDRSLNEAMQMAGLRVDQCISRFLPYTMAGRKTPHPLLIRAYLSCRPAWRVMGKQFLVVASKPGNASAARCDTKRSAA